MGALKDWKAGYRVAAVTAVALWGASFTAMRLLLETVPTPLLVLSRLVIAAIFLLALAGVLRRRIVLKHLGVIVVLAVVGVFGHQLLQTTGMETALAITAGVIVAVIPAWTCILGAAFLRERLTPLQIVGVCVAFAGVLVVVDAPRALAGISLTAFTRGDLLVLASTFLWAAYTILVRANPQAQSDVGDTGLLMGVAALMFVPLVSWRDAVTVWSEMSLAQWIALLGLGIGASGIAFWLWSYALREIGATEASAWIYTEPLFAAVFAMALLGERPSPMLAIGAVIVLAGVALTQRLLGAPRPARSAT